MYQLGNHLYILDYEEYRDRPNLIYIQGTKRNIAIDAGSSLDHLHLFYRELAEMNLEIPDLTIITHWHWDHTFALPYIPNLTIASKTTQQKLKEVAKWKWDEESMHQRLQTHKEIEFCDKHIRLEYSDCSKILVTEAECTFEKQMNINLGDHEIIIYDMDSPHSRDATIIYVPMDEVLILGDAACGDFYDLSGAYDQQRLKSFIAFVERVPCKWIIEGHREPVLKEALLLELKNELQ